MLEILLVDHAASKVCFLNCARALKYFLLITLANKSIKLKKSNCHVECLEIYAFDQPVRG
jgi:hypothetical protein